VIEGVASRLQDQEIKRVFLEAQPVLEIRERVRSIQQSAVSQNKD